MRLQPLVSLALTVVLWGCGDSPAPESAGSEADERAVEQVMTGLFEALGAGDTLALDALLADDFYLFEHALWTRDTLVSLMSGVPGQTWSLDEFQTQVEGSMAYTTYHNRAIMMMDGEPVTRRWLESGVLIRRNGRWLLRFMHSTRM